MAIQGLSAQSGATGPPRTTLAQLLGTRGALPPDLALELIDRLAVRLAAGSFDVGRLVRLSPATVEVELDGDGPAGAVRSVRLLPGPAPAETPPEPYMAWPELGQAMSGSSGLGQADAGGEAAAVYCLGVLLYHMLQGRAPFAARNIDVLATMHLRAEPPRPASEAAATTAEDVLWRALAKRRDDRYPSIAALRDAVAGVRTAPAGAGAAAAAAAAGPAPGDFGPFRAGESLAAPPHAPTFRATDERTQTAAVVHVLPLPERIEPALLQAIDEGLRGARELDACPGIARLLDWRIADAGGGVARPSYLVREYVDGRSVRSLLRSQRRVQPAHALQIVEQVAEALACLERSGRVHGAVHPENVFVAADGTARVTDWAVSYVRRAVQGGAAPGGAGPPPSVYRAPETYRGQEPDGRSDLFCLGLLLYELIAGAPPFPPPGGDEASGDEDVWRKRLGKDRLALPGAPEAVERIVFKALAVDPLDRYAESQGMLADIELVLRPAARRAVLRAASGATFAVDRSQIVLGRLHPGSLPYPDVNLAGEPGGDTVSRQHARLYFQDGRWWIVQQQDIVNWTYVQGRLLHTGEAAPLQDGDRLDVGQVTLTFHTAPARRDERTR